jgi:phosphomannomutase
MTLLPKIFKAYDIRGVVPTELDAAGARLVGQAAVRFTGAKTLVVGKDMRESTPQLFETFADGVLGQGADIIDVGLVTTPMFYFAVGDYELHDAGVMVTASHNPKQYNGFKLCHGDVMPIGAASGIYDVRDLALQGPYPEQARGQIVETDIRAAYLERLFRQVDASKFRPLKVVVDTGNGMEGVIIKEIFERLPKCELTGLFLDLDGNFPNHEANPLKEETLDALKAEIRRQRADFGVAFDDDADRVGLVDELGNVVRGDLILALLAPRLLKKEPPGTAVLYDVRESLVAAEEIERAGGRAVMCRVGHGLIKPQMRQDKAVFAGELSNHFYFRDFYNAESSDLVMLLVMELMSETGKKLSELVAPLRRYHHSGEMNFEVADKDAVLAKVEEVYGREAAAVIRIDGVRMDFRDQDRPSEDWWFSVRASNTEPLLRLNLEAKSKSKMEAKREELLKLIRQS